MKKLIALIMITTLLLSGCSLLGQAEKSVSLSDKLSGLERDEHQAEETVAEQPATSSQYTFKQIDPLGFINGGTLSEEQAVDQYDLTYDDAFTMEFRDSWEVPSAIVYQAPLAENLPGTHGGTAFAIFSDASNIDYLSSLFYQYWYYPDDAVITSGEVFSVYNILEDALRQEYGAPTEKLFWSEQSAATSVDGLSDKDLLTMLIESSSKEDTYVSSIWPLDDGLTISIVLETPVYDDISLRLDFAYFDYVYDGSINPIAEESTPAAEESSAAEEKPSALYTEPSGSATAMDMVRLGTYANDDVFGIGFVWSVTFYNDYTFEFSYDHEEGSEYFTGNWHTEDSGGELRVILDVTGEYPFTTSLDVDGGKYIYFDDGMFTPDIVVLPFVG
ncbi:hypothetical protein LJC56_10325 [Christensenellaceae bacterium OttesenSCG-928-K19]|nr:hypothetical protein [Christensenellaceae bacterium OttesenSCG-928-K19]